MGCLVCESIHIDTNPIRPTASLEDLLGCDPYIGLLALSGKFGVCWASERACCYEFPVGCLLSGMKLTIAPHQNSTFYPFPLWHDSQFFKNETSPSPDKL